MLNEALVAAGVDRSRTYATNAVKHFKWEARGKRRIHSKPDYAEMDACQPWLLAELAVIRPRIVVALGATAAHTLLGRAFRVTKQRGELVAAPSGWWVMATVHPSSILRAPDDAARHAAMDEFIDDLRRIPEHLGLVGRQAA